MPEALHKLYAVPHSLFAGRARSYLIKAGIPFREYSMGHPSFKRDVLPKAGLSTIPVLVTPDGQVIRDGAAIVEHFEAATGRPFRPTTAKQRILSAVFDLIGTDGLFRPAMHYRWNFPDENEAYLHSHFSDLVAASEKREEKVQSVLAMLRTRTEMRGVVPERFELIETLYVEFLNALNRHFERVPYLFGGRPSIGDFGLIIPLYAHLGRDPAPAQLMRKTALRVHRWVERMNRPDRDAGEFFDIGDGYLESDEIPETLVDVLNILAEDLIPETKAAAAAINQWLAENSPASGEPSDRFINKAVFNVRGEEFQAVAQPYRFYMLQEVQTLFAGLNAEEQADVVTLLAACGVQELLDIQLDRQAGLADNLEIWL
ncbi:MAG: glutathione S-transferase family protein [Woeseiaceae bacterium]